MRVERRLRLFRKWVLSGIFGSMKDEVTWKWVLSGIFGSMKDEVTWEWGRLHNQEPYDLYFSPHS